MTICEKDTNLIDVISFRLLIYAVCIFKLLKKRVREDEQDENELDFSTYY